MTSYECVKTLSMPLPEDILKRKWGGDIDGAIRAIDLRLATALPEALRMRLTVEKERLRRLPTQYPYNRAQALEKLKELLPGATEALFDQLELQGLLDYLYLNGEKRYFVRAMRSAAQLPAVRAMVGGKANPSSPYLDPMLAEIRQKGELARKITLELHVSVDEDAFVPGTYRAWVPFPIPCAQQREIRLLAGDPDILAPEDAPARTAYWERECAKKADFSLRCSYVSRIRFADPLHISAPTVPLYPDARPVSPEDLAEDGTYLRFTPYLRSLAEEICRGAATPVEKAWRCYEFVTTKVTYTFMRDYFQIDDLGEYCAVNLKGDCGLQALLFILLCRISGIPARWQSGLDISEKYVGSHDWAQFYLEGWGWLFADPSFGGSAWRNGSQERHAFYFGNLDPMRMAANRAFMADLTPPMQGFRVDPYDNQSGEIERIGAELAFTGRQTGGDQLLISVENA